MRVYEDVCTYDCNEGYTLTAEAGGTATFEIDCMATGEFSEPTPCLPVVCGPVPDFDFAKITSDDRAKYEDPSGELSVSVVFPEKVHYECIEGYSLTGKYGDETKFSIGCLPSGGFSKAPRCRRVTCGIPANVDNALHLAVEIFYMETVTYSCLNGYTRTGA